MLSASVSLEEKKKEQEKMKAKWENNGAKFISKKKFVRQDF